METYYDKYLSYINSIKNKLFHLNQKRQGLLQQLEKDYEQGLIDELNYNSVKKSSVIDLLPSHLQKYSLTKEEIEYIKTNGKLLDGEISLGLINDYLQSKLDLINSICSSVIEGENIYNMNPSELREYLKSSTILRYRTQIQKCTSIIEERRVKLGSKAIYDITYSNATKEKAKLESEQSSILNYIETVTEEELYQYAYRMHKVNGTYYEWFKSKQSIQEHEERSTHRKALSTLGDAKNNITNLSNRYQIIRRNNEDIDHFVIDYLTFIQNADIETILNQTNIKLKSYIFTPKKKRIEETYINMQKVFSYMFNKYPTLRSYIIDIYNIPRMVDQNNRVVYDINPQKAFELYFNNQYQNIDNITIIDFIEKLLSNITKYASHKYQRLTNNRMMNQLSYETSFNSLASSIYATEEDIRNVNFLETNYSAPRTINLPREYISSTEEQEIFTNLQQVLIEQRELRRRNIHQILSLK